MGSSGGQSMWMPADDDIEWQHPRERGAAQGRQFYVAIKADDSPREAPAHVIIHGTDELAWTATLEPFKREIPAAIRHLIEFGHMNDASEARRDVGRWDWDAGSDRVLRRLWPDTFIRDVYIKGAHRDLGNAAVIGTGVSVDRSHMPVVAARVRAGGALPILGHRAFELLLPRGFGWSDVVDLKRERAMIEFAAIMRDVEATALDRAVSLADLERVLRDHYWQRVVDAEGRRPGRWLKYGITAIGWFAGELGTLASTGVPLAGGAIGAAAGHSAGELADRALRPRWLSIHHRLLRHRERERAAAPANGASRDI
jgi:hypothetical protein